MSVSESYLANLHLSDAQLALLNIESGKHIVNAPPGAGKTALLTARLAKACERYNDDADIIALTFTTRAATEMQQRAHDLLGERAPFIGNFHTFCMNTIRCSRLPYSQRTASVLPDEYRNKMFEMAQQYVTAQTLLAQELPIALTHALNDILQSGALQQSQDEYQQRYQAPTLRSVFLNAYIGLRLLDIKSQHTHQALITYELARGLPELLAAVLDQVASVQHEPELALQFVWQVLQRFKKIKTQARCLDFDDVLVLGLDELTQHPVTRAFIQIDEVQDLNPIQWRLIDILSTPQTHVFAVGDTEQSIYGFLGADLSLLAKHTADFTPHTLSQNFRSVPGIITILNHYRTEHWQLPPIAAMVDPATENQHSTMLLEYEDVGVERAAMTGGIGKILSDPDRNVGMLVPTNKICEEYAHRLSENGISFFQVSQHDLMQKPVVQDGLSWLKVLNGQASRMDWWNLLYRLSRHTGGNTLTLKDVIRCTGAIHQQGVTIEALLGDPTDLFSYPLRQFAEAYPQEGVVIFDTETTGLDFFSDKIIQLAAVRVVNGEVVAEFDRYVDVGLAQNANLLAAFTNSQAIHKIQREQVDAGDMLNTVLADFFAFVGSSPLVAHNLHFDMMMLRTNLQDLPQEAALLSRYHTFLAQHQFDTLTLARMFYPGLPSYKLADLLERFDLEGVNSHNAIDDVKATASLLHKIMGDIELKLPDIDAVLDQYTAIIQPVKHHLSVLQKPAAVFTQQRFACSLVDVLRIWFQHAQHQSAWYDTQNVQSTVRECERKLMPWLDKQGFYGDFCTLVNPNLWQNHQDPDIRVKINQIDTLFLLKEIDLIDPDKDKVVLSTIHRAKGLEFETVMLPEVTESAFPGFIEKLPPDIQRTRIAEATRLLYVALSRPKDKLIVSYHKRFGKYPKRLSPFLQTAEPLFKYRNWT